MSPAVPLRSDLVTVLVSQGFPLLGPEDHTPPKVSPLKILCLALPEKPP